MLKFLKTYQRGGFLVLYLIVAAIGVLKIFSTSTPTQTVAAGVLYDVCFAWTADNQWFVFIIWLSELLFVGWLMRLIQNKIKLSKNLNYLPIFCFLMLACSLGSSITPLFIASLFIYLGIFQVMLALNETDESRKFFSTGFLFGIAELFYEYSLFFLLPLFGVLIFCRKFHWREWIFLTLGFLCVWYIIGTAYFVMFDDYELILREFGKFADINIVNFQNLPTKTLIIFSFFSLILLAFVGKISNFLKHQKLIMRDIYLFFLWLIIFTAAQSFFVQDFINQGFIVLAMPYGFLLGCELNDIKKNWLGEILIWSMLAVAIISQIS